MKTEPNIPYKIYLAESELPTAWYNVRADMKNKPAPLLNPGTLQPMTAKELDGVFCDELVQQELDDTTALSMACSYFGLDCKVYMVKVSYEQKPFSREVMRTYGASVTPSPSMTTNVGRKILAEHPDTTGSRAAIDEALKCRETGEEKTIVFGLTGTGYFDMVAYEKFHDGQMSDYIPTDADLQEGFDGIPRFPGNEI